MKFSRGPILGDIELLLNRLCIEPLLYHKQALMLCLATLGLFVAYIPTSKAQESGVNHILILDKTASMVGQGASRSSKNIWPDVRDSILFYIDRNVQVGDSVKIYPYTDRLNSESLAIEISNKKDEGQVKSFVKNIEFDSTFTCVYDALNQVVRNNKLNDQNADLISLYTDGLDDGLEYCNVKLEDAVRAFVGEKDSRDQLTYVPLNLKVPGEIKAESNDNPWFRIGTMKAPSPVYIKPKATSLRFSKNRRVLNQKFRIVNENLLSQNCKLEASVHLDSLDKGMYDPELSSGKTLDPRTKTEFAIDFLNDPVPKRDKPYGGYIEYKVQSSCPENVTVKPKRTTIQYRNAARATVNITYPDTISSRVLTRADTISGVFQFDFNDKAVESNTQLSFLIKGNKDQLAITPERGEVEGNKWNIQVSQLQAKRKELKNSKVPFHIYPDSPLVEKAGGSLQIKLNKDNKLKQGSKIKTSGKAWTVSGIETYTPAPLWWKVVQALLAALASITALWLIWSLFLRNWALPPMRGTVMIGRNTISVNGIRKLVLYRGQKPDEAKQNWVVETLQGSVKAEQIDQSNGDTTSYLKVEPHEIDQNYLKLVPGEGITFNSPHNDQTLYSDETHTVTVVSDNDDKKKKEYTIKLIDRDRPRPKQKT